MLELLFQGFVEWLYGLVLECWEYFASVLFDLMSLDFAYLREHIPIIDTIRQIMLGVGWALLIGNLVFQATRGMAAGLGFDAEDPKLLFTRTFAFSFLLVASPQICELGLNMTSAVIELLQMPDAVDITFADEASFAGMARGVAARCDLRHHCYVPDVQAHYGNGRAVFHPRRADDHLAAGLWYGRKPEYVGHF